MYLYKWAQWVFTFQSTFHGFYRCVRFLNKTPNFAIQSTRKKAERDSNAATKRYVWMRACSFRLTQKKNEGLSSLFLNLTGAIGSIIFTKKVPVRFFWVLRDKLNMLISVYNDASERFKKSRRVTRPACLPVDPPLLVQ